MFQQAVEEKELGKQLQDREVTHLKMSLYSGLARPSTTIASTHIIIYNNNKKTD